jgi:hypothetical protein
MKKFSIISKYPVSEKTKDEIKQLNEEDLFKIKVKNIMDQFLSIQTYGPIDRYQRAGNIKIVGQDMFIEALLDILNDKTTKEEKKILESLKSSINNNILDTKILEVNKKIEEAKNNNKIILHKNKLDSLYNNYKNDEDILIKMVKESCNKITKLETIQLRKLAIESMINDNRYPKKLFMNIYQIYKNRYDTIISN